MADRDQLHFDSYDESDPDPSHKTHPDEEGYLCELGPGADEFYQRYWRPGAGAKAALKDRDERERELLDDADRPQQNGGTDGRTGASDET